MRTSRPRRLSVVSALVLAATGLGAVPATPPGLPTIDLPIREVTVFSDRARVVRRAEVPLEIGERRIRLPLLPVTLDPGSVRVEARGARVVRVEVRKVDRADFPVNEAKALIEELERLDDELRALNGEKEPLERERALLLGLRLNASPFPVQNQPPVPLDPTGWKVSFAFLEAREAAVTAALEPLEKRLTEKHRERMAVAERARRLAADDTSRPGHAVEAILERQRPRTEVTLTYVAKNARWYPAYDIRATPGAAEVDVEFAGLVAQETGEDWTEARLVLSSAVPANVPALPELLTWKISERERFVPTPRAAPEPRQPRPTPPLPQPLGMHGRVDTDPLEEETQLRERLLAVAEPRRTDAREFETAGYGTGAAPTGGRYDSGGAGPAQQGRASARRAAPPAPPPAPGTRAVERRKAEAADLQADTVAVLGTRARDSSESFSGASFTSGQIQVERLPFGAPSGWRMPSYASDLPAALAGGYDFTFPSTRPETIGTGAGPQRVALGARRFPATMRLQIFPALRKEAYVVAELTNTGATPLLQGRANLFSGADLQGHTVLPTTAAGEQVTVSLGVDEAIGVARNVRTVEGERGLFGRQDVGTYEVTIELLNQRDRPVLAQVKDQVPLSAVKDKVEVKFESADFDAKPDPANGILEWNVELAAGQKRTLTHRFTIARPIGWKPYETFAPLETGR